MRFQAPGPCTGMSATLSDGLISPSRALLATFVFVEGTLVLTVEVVEFADDSFVIVVGGVKIVVVDTGITLARDVVRVVVVELCREKWCGSRATCVLLEVVRVKTRTSSNSGLDHIKRWALCKVKRCFVMVLAG